MYRQTIRHSTFISQIDSTTSQEELVQQDDPLLGSIPNFKDLRCNQLEKNIIKVRTIFLREMCDIGNAASDISLFELGEFASIEQNNPNSTDFVASDLRIGALSNLHSTTCMVKDPSSTKVFDVSQYLSTKEIGKLITSQESPENQERLIVATKQCLMGSTILLLATQQHYLDHKTEIETCNELAPSFDHVFFQTWLSNAKVIIDNADFTRVTGSITHDPYTIIQVARPDIKVSNEDESIVRSRRLQEKQIRQSIKKDLQQLDERLTLKETFITLLTTPEAISQLLSFTAGTEGQEKEFYASIKKIVMNHQIKKADAAAEALLKDIEQEKKKPSCRKRRPPKKSTKSLEQASTSPLSQPSHVMKQKQPPSEPATHPTDCVKLADINLLKQVHIVDKPLLIHDRIKRWARTTCDTIRHITEWDHKTNELIYPYELDPCPEYTIACHNLAYLKQLLQSNLATIYAQPYSFIDEEKITRTGWALISDMRLKDTEYKGIVFAAANTGRVLYHAHFRQFHQRTKYKMLNTLSDQLQEVSHINCAEGEAQADTNSNWKPIGSFVTERHKKEGKPLLLMKTKNKDVMFAFYPLTE